MQRLAAQRALPESRQSSYYQTHPGAAERLGVYQDHVATQTGRVEPLDTEIIALNERLKTKLRAYVEPPRSVLARFDDASKINHLYAKSIAMYRRGDLGPALTLIEKLVKMEPQDAFFHEFHGDILLSLAEADKAASAYEKAITIRPDSPQILLNYGRALIATNKSPNFTRAIAALEKARDGEPKWAFTHRQLAVAYGRAGQLANADITLAEEALLKGDTEQAIKMAKRSLSRGNVGKAIQNRANDILFRYGAQ